MKLNRTAIIILVCCALLIFTGVVLAVTINRQKPEAIDNARPTDSSRPSHYPGLETVVIPESLPEQIKEFEGFTISFNKKNRTPNYVAWELLGNETEGNLGRHDKFWTDPEIEGCPTTGDYTRSGYDRGHLCPSADQKWSARAMENCFVMANIAPQAHALNNGAWKTLETKERQWARRDSAIVIIAGPLYSEADKETIGTNRVRVPGAFFKVILAPYLEEPRAIAFVYPNSESPGNMQNYAMSVDKLEEITGFDFFPALPDDIENAVKSSFSFKEWNKTR